MELFDKLTAKYPAEHFSTSTTQTVIEEDDQQATARMVTIEHLDVEVLKIDKTLFVAIRDSRHATDTTSTPAEVCDGAIATEYPTQFICYVELKSKCSQNEVVKARSQIMASHHHMLTIAKDCTFSLTDFIQKGIIVTQPITDETMTKARQRRKRDDDNNIIFSHARFLLKLIEGNAKDEATGICFVHALATDVVHLKDLL